MNVIKKDVLMTFIFLVEWMFAICRYWLFEGRSSCVGQ